MLDRISILKDKMLSQPRYVSIEQALIITRTYQENEDKSIPYKRALSLYNALNEIEIGMEPEELIVGNRTKGVRYGVVFPESGISWVDREFETIPTSSHENEEFESYKYYRNNTFDKASIENDIRDILHLVRQRSIAKHIDSVNITKDTPVYMYGEMANLIVGNIMENASYASHVMQSNHYDIDKPVSNTKFDMILKGQIEGAANASAFDNHGVVLKETEIIHDGINTNLFGDIQYGHYLNAKEIKLFNYEDTLKINNQN